MRCSTCQDVLSARLDGEDVDVALDDLDAHVADCAECRRFSLDITDVHRLIRVRAAEAVPDLTRSILEATAGAAPRPDVTSGAETGLDPLALVVIGLTMLALALPSLVLHDSGNAIHLTQEISAWDAAFGVGLLFAAWHGPVGPRPAPDGDHPRRGQVLGSVIDVASVARRW